MTTASGTYLFGGPRGVEPRLGAHDPLLRRGREVSPAEAGEAPRWQNGDASASVEAASASVAMAAKARTDVRCVTMGASVLLVNNHCRYPKNASLLTM